MVVRALPALLVLAWGGWAVAVDGWEGAIGLGVAVVIAAVARPVAVAGSVLAALALAAPLAWIAVVVASGAGALTAAPIDALPVAALPGIAVAATLAAAAGARSGGLRLAFQVAACLSVAAALAVPEPVSLAPLAVGCAVAVLSRHRAFFRTSPERTALVLALAAAGVAGWLLGELDAVAAARAELLARAGGGPDWTAVGLAAAAAALGGLRLVVVARRSLVAAAAAPGFLAHTLLAVVAALVAAAAAGEGAPGRLGWVVAGLVIATGTVRLRPPAAPAEAVEQPAYDLVVREQLLQDREQRVARQLEALAIQLEELDRRRRELAAEPVAEPVTAIAAVPSPSPSPAELAFARRLERFEAVLAGVEARERALELRESDVRAREAAVLAAPAGLSVPGWEPAPAPAAAAAAAAAPAVASPRSIAPLRLPALERLVSDHGAEFPERVDEWHAYLHYLRDLSDVHGNLGPGFDWLIADIFADLLERSGGV